MEDLPKIALRSTQTMREAEQIVALLSDHGIKSVITRDSGDLDASIQGESIRNKFEILIHENQHEEAEAILVEDAKKHLDKITSDYYLHSFSDDELFNVLVEKNEWSEFDVLLSEKILKDRGVTIDSALLMKRQKERDASFETPESGQKGWIIFGYITSFIGGFIGILLGYSLWKSKKKLPSGKKVPAYTENIRSHGKNIFYIGVAVFTLIWILRFSQMAGVFN